MSGIFGIVHFDGSPVPDEAIEAMRSAMSPWGPDGIRVWRDGDAALGQCVLFDTPEARWERLPHAAGPVAFTAEARIDNRADLFAEYGIPPSTADALADGELLRIAYERSGEGAPARVFGDWSMAAWHRDSRTLFLARDHYGITSLYYCRDAKRLAFASDRRALLGLPGADGSMDELYLAQMLVAWPEYYGERTIHSTIRRVPPAHSLRATAQRAERTRYWRLEDAPRLTLRHLDDYADGLREQLSRAVRSRLRSLSPIASTLSGGLDSSAVTAVAAHALGQSGRALHAITAVPCYTPARVPGRQTDEGPLARATAAAFANIIHTSTDSAAVSPLDGVGRMLRAHGEPGHSASNYFWMTDVLSRAGGTSGGALLIAQSGNGSLSWKGVPTAGSIWRAILRGSYRSTYREVRGLLGQAWRHWQAVPWWHTQTAISPAFARRIRLQELMHESGYEPYPVPGDAVGEHMRLLAPGRTILGALWAELGAAYRVSVRDPTMDARLLRFAVGLPPHVWRARGNRWLVRSAMQGLVPDEVRLNERRGIQAADLGERLLHEGDRLGLVLATLRDSIAAEYLDVARMAAVVEGLQREPGRADLVGAGSAVLLRGVGAGQFVLANRQQKPLEYSLRQ